MTALVGRTLNDRYEILERLGGGGMAVVYKARDTRLGRPVSIKVLRDQYTMDADFLSRFRREAQAVASLSHPNIVSIYDVGRDGDVHYLVMEYVEGETLKTKIARERPLPPAVAVDITLQILEALEHAHRRRVIHRDIKPHNIMITRDGLVKVTDFGVARADGGTIVHTGAIVGSAHYFSPEQARGGHVDARSDLYSLGVVLFEMLSGRLPFDGENPLSVALKHVQERPPSARTLQPSVPPALDRIVARALAKDPARRYASVAEFRADLRAWQRSDPAPLLPAAAVAEAAGTREEAGGSEEDTFVVRDRLLDEALGEEESPEEAEAPPEGRDLWRRALAVLGVLAVVAAGAGYGLYAFLRWFNVPSVQVPGVVGLSLPDAQRELSRAGLGWEVGATRSSRDVPANYVLSQNPAAGEEVKRGRRIQLVLSKGPDLVEVPDVTGKHRYEARNVLENLGFAVDESERYDETVNADYVIEQSPRGGNRVEQGSTVYLRVSLGPPPPPFPMPNLVGGTRDDADRILADTGLRPGVVTEALTGFPAGVVASQSPAPGVTVRAGEAVDLVVSSGCAATTPRSVPITGPGPVLLRAVLSDRSGERVIYEARHQPGERAAFDVCWDGIAARLLLYADGELVSREVLVR